MVGEADRVDSSGYSSASEASGLARRRLHSAEPEGNNNNQQAEYYQVRVKLSSVNLMSSSSVPSAQC